MPSWTKEQQEAINEEGKNIIVSAGAGSGKTAVLSERVIRKLEKTDINKLLILTFTKEAANEMKERIRKKIKKNESLKKQLDLIDSAYITTFDSYALSLVKKYYYLLNISPNIGIIDASIINIKKEKYLDEIFDKLYEENNILFEKLIKDFCIKDDKEIKRYIIELNNKLDLKLNKEEYIDNYIENFFNDETINKNIEKYVNLIKEKIKEINNLLYDIQILVDGKYYEKLIEVLNPLLNSNTYIEFRDFGKKVCVDYRRIDESSLVKLPYYPYIDKSVAFEGLPFEIDNKKIILSGGDLYKTFDKNLTYYCLVEELIKKTDCVFLYVGKGDRRYLEELKSKYPTKIYIENERKDLFQLMKCSYIYLNTYPQMGGLMTQYAVMANKVPFTLCINGDLKGVLLNEKPGTIYYSDMHTMIADIIRSISDSEFLKNKYEAIKDSVISPERFALELERIMLSHRSTFVFLSEKTNINKFGESYKDRFSALDICDAVASRRNLHLFIYFPLQFMNGMLNKCGRLLKKVIRNE